MLKYGNREFRNLQEQVEQNMKDIQDIRQGDVVLNQFGIKVVGQIASLEDLPTVAEYKEDNEDWSYGDAFAIGTEDPYELYILTRQDESHEGDWWFDIGPFPQPGPQGEDGEQGEVGPTPVITGAATVTTLSAGQSATVSVTKSGTDAAPTLTFAFGIPQGEAGVAGEMGATGPQGPQGPTGPQGPKGDTGNFNLVGVLASESLLPDPDEVPLNTAYLVGASTPYDVYIILNDSEGKSWIDAGPIVDVDIDNFVQLDEDNTFVGNNTFTKTVTIGGNGSTTEGLEIKSLSGTYKTRLETVNGNLIIKNSAGTPMATIKASGGITVNTINPNNNNYGLISPDTTSWAVNKTIATTDQIPAAVSGTNDGTNWTSLTVGNDTYGLASGGTPITITTTAGSESISDGVNTLNVVTRDTAQTITGVKKFGELKVEHDYVNEDNEDATAKVDVSFVELASNVTTHIDLSDNDVEIHSYGGDVKVVAEGGMVVDGLTKINPNSTGYGLVMPTTHSWVADKNIATTDMIPTAPADIGALVATACTYQTTAPSAAIADGGIHIVYLSSEPATKYSGYIYMIAEA